MDRKQKTRDFIKAYAIVIVFLAAVIILAILFPTFRIPRNLMNVAKQAAVNGIISMGMMMVMISGGIDLSLGSIVGLSAVCAAMFSHPNPSYPLIVPILLGTLVGTLMGLVNGVGVAYGELPPFIITLGTMGVCRGLALVVSGGVPVTNLSTVFKSISGGTFLGMPNLAYYLVIVVLIVAFVMTKTVFGRHVYSIGGNVQASMVSGINVKKNLVAIYMLSGLLAGIAGVLMASRTSQGAPTIGEGYEMDAVTAVIMGGVSMKGGAGKWWGVLVGALMLAVINNMLTIIGVDPNWERVVKGTIIIGAVLLDVNLKRRKS